MLNNFMMKIFSLNPTIL